MDKIKNRIIWIIKNYDFNKVDIWKYLKQQLNLLKEYLESSLSRVLPIQIISQLSEILIILKQGLIEYIVLIAPFEVNSCFNSIKLLDQIDYSEIKIENDFLSLLSTYLDTVSSIISSSFIVTSDKLINELFISCVSFQEAIKLIIFYLFSKDLNEITDTNNSSTKQNKATNKKQLNRKTLINFLKELEYSNEANINEQNAKINLKGMVSCAVSIIEYLNKCSGFYLKVSRQENLENRSK